jgi:hypothetical protein
MTGRKMQEKKFVSETLKGTTNEPVYNDMVLCESRLFRQALCDTN